jgi:hypothetical protein
MDWGSPEFVIAIIAVSTIGWLVNNWIRARHGYALEDEWGGKTAHSDTQDAQKLRAENAELRATLAKVDKRMQVLERIVTDKGYDVADQIEALRDQRRVEAQGGGVPLDTARRERV